jgi:hypothetical protein
MATGDTNDNVNRLRATLAPWFPDLSAAPVLNAVLTGIGDAFAFVYNYLQFAKLQTRIATATGGWLDLIGWDFFGSRFARRQGESDSSWQPRILQEILRPRQTRAAISLMLTQLTGRAPLIVEGWNTGDEGSYGTGDMGYGAGLGYGSLNYNDQVFITAYRQNSNGVPLVSGYGMVGGGYGVGSLSYIDLSQITGPITDAEIYARVQQTVAAGITAWVDIANGPAANPTIPAMVFDIAYDSTYVAVL